jgi:hypothetical protein
MHAIRIPSTKFFYQFIFLNLDEDVSWVFQSKLFFVLGKKSVQSLHLSFFHFCNFLIFILFFTKN